MEDQPDFVQAPKVAVGYVDVEETILTGRRLPCICPEQDKGAKGISVCHSRSRGLVIERVACDRCPRTWTRVNCR